MMQGIIEKVENKTGRTSGNQFEVITIKGIEYSHFDDLNTFHEGDTIEFDFKESGKYKNITNIQLVKPTTTPQKPHTSTGDEIRRMSCIRSAVEFWGLKQATKITEENIIETAKKFSAFVMGKDIEGNPNEKLEEDDDLLQELTLLCKSEQIGIDTFNDYCQDQYMTKLLLMRTETIRTMMDQWDTTVGKLKTWKTRQQED